MSLSPAEIPNVIIASGERKARLKLWSALILAMLAGLFISLGGLGSLLASSLDSPFAKFLGAAIFPVGLILVVLAGAELFTGNNLMSLACLNRKITLRQLLRSWAIVWLGNLLGAVSLAVLVCFAGTLTDAAAATATSLAESKVALSIPAMLARGILCNILVVLAVWMATASKSVTGKILAIWFPVMLFVFCGFEHSVANMFFLPLAALLGANLSFATIATNLLFVTLGNLIGGAIIIPFAYHAIYKNTK